MVLTPARPFFRVASASTSRPSSLRPSGPNPQSPPGSLKGTPPSRPSTARSDFTRTWILRRHCEPSKSSSSETATPRSTDTRGLWTKHLLPPPGSPRFRSSASRRERPVDAETPQAAADQVRQELTAFDARLSLDSSVKVGTLSQPKASTVNGAKDYLLTRTLFHAQMLSGLTSIKQLLSISEDELNTRLDQLRRRYGAARFGRHDFHIWLSELAQTQLLRSETDAVFASLDDGRSGSVDEHDVVLGLQAVLHGRHRTLLNFVRTLLGDVRATVGTVMNANEVNDLLDAIASVSRRRYPEVDHALLIVKRSMGEFTQQAQVPTFEFCRALQVNPLISRILSELQEDGRLPPSPPPPPSPDPDRDVSRVPLVAPPPPPQSTEDSNGGTLSMEASLTRLPARKVPKKPQAAAGPVLGKLDVAHPGFRADVNLNLSKVNEPISESTDADWFIRNSVVWCRTAQGEVPVD